MKPPIEKCGRSPSVRLGRENDLFHEFAITKEYAHFLVTALTNLGIIVNPNVCEKCGNNKNVIAHHDNYFRAFDVMWLCRSCHANRHTDMRLSGSDPCDHFCQKILESPLGENYLSRLRQFYTQVAELSSELFDESFFDQPSEFPNTVKLSLSVTDEDSQH